MGGGGRKRRRGGDVQRVERNKREGRVQDGRKRKGMKVKGRRGSLIRIATLLCKISQGEVKRKKKRKTERER